jgi:hypothetical protein
VVELCHKRCLLNSLSLFFLIAVISGANNSAERTAQRVKNDNVPVVDIINDLLQDIEPDEHVNHGNGAAAPNHLAGHCLSPNGSDYHFQYAHEE